MLPLGKRIRELRKKKKMKQMELAILISKTKSTISSFERGTRQPNNMDLVKLSKILGTSSDYLLGITNDPSSNDNGLVASQLDGQFRNFSKDEKDLITDFMDFVRSRRNND